MHSTLCLFATLPAEKAHAIPAEAAHESRRLSLEFMAHVVRSRALRKVFVSVKGIYYQAEVQGQPVTWLMPHALAQVLPRLKRQVRRQTHAWRSRFHSARSRP